MAYPSQPAISNRPGDQGTMLLEELRDSGTRGASEFQSCWNRELNLQGNCSLPTAALETKCPLSLSK